MFFLMVFTLNLHILRVPGLGSFVERKDLKHY